MELNLANKIITNNLQELCQTLQMLPDGESILAEYVSDITKLTKTYTEKATLLTAKKPHIPRKSSTNTYQKKAPTANYTNNPNIATYTEIALKKSGKQTGLGYHHVKNLWEKRIQPHNETDQYAILVVQQIIQNYCKYYHKRTV